MNNYLLGVRNGQFFGRSDLPRLAMEDFRQTICGEVARGRRLVALFRIPTDLEGRLVAILAERESALLYASSCPVDEAYPALTPDCPQAHLFEREIYETSGVRPVGHPWLKPVRFPLESFHQDKNVGNMDYYRVDGDAVHEVAVGPVHAGVIEPGHFRFQCHGETVFSLEISLGYQHRGVERSMPGAAPRRRLGLAETVSGDSTVGHTMAYCGVVESLGTGSVPARAQAIRGIALELERIACHVGDLGALSGDIGFLPTSSFCGWIRGNVLNMTASLCGNRFSRGFLRPGGVAYDIDQELAADLLQRIRAVRADTADTLGLFWETPTVLARLEATGTVSRESAWEIGMVGPAARASGVDTDVRRDFPHGVYQYRQIPIAFQQTGDVAARARIRWLELQRSLTFVEEMLGALPESELLRDPGPARPDAMTVSLVEGWRGEICHFGATDSSGDIEVYKIVDPSFHNWHGLSLALRGEAISDFPLCNKSFNLSYCGFDL